MKMPKRPWYPPTPQRPDIFGLHHVTLAGAACENDAARGQRIAKVEAGVAAAFKAAIHHLGEEEARELFNRVMRRPKRGRGKALASDRDARLLKAYDAAPEGESIAAIARRLRSAGTELGNTAGAISRQIRKLVDDRKERERRARIEARRWRMAMRHEPPTLASAAVSAAKTREK
jgi:hypothetical protein